MMHFLRPLTSRLELTFALLVCGLALTGCANPLSTANPQQVDLSGSWQLVPERSQAPPKVTSNGEGARSRGRRRDDHLGHLRPVIRANTMVIEQTGSTMGIDYKGFPYRDVSWGKRTRGTFEVTAGWIEGELHIRSKRGRMVLTEIYRLSADKQQLLLAVQFRGGSNNGNTFNRVFVRKP